MSIQPGSERRIVLQLSGSAACAASAGGEHGGEREGGERRRAWHRSPSRCRGGSGLDSAASSRSKAAARSVRVYSVRGAAKIDAAVAGFDHVAVLHDDDLVGERADDAEVVRDEDVGEAVLRLQPAQQVDDLHLDGHVEGGGRLVEDDELRLQDHRAGDGDALALAAGELVRVAVGGRGVEADLAAGSRRRGLPRRRGRARRGPRRRSARPTCAGRASRRGPGTPSACRGAGGGARGASSPGCPGRGRRCGPRTRSAA